MPNHHLVRVGVMGQVGRFRSIDATKYERGRRVVLRTQRGLEIGHVLQPHGNTSNADSPDGEILRAMSVEDELLAERLDRNKDRAFEACRQKLQQVGTVATLIDVELLFDGRSLFFYFLGNVTPEIETLTSQLAELYQTKVKFRQFTDALTNGCGPDCGTGDATGGCDNCTSCAVSSACGVAR
ncbi:MAG: PSP1 C-terminal domain-containing protein [Pirellulales bacterium]